MEWLLITMLERRGGMLNRLTTFIIFSVLRIDIRRTFQIMYSKATLSFCLFRSHLEEPSCDGSWILEERRVLRRMSLEMIQREEFDCLLTRESPSILLPSIGE